jgi:site-specific recombinase XerD
MLEIFFKAAHTLERLRTALTAPYIDGFAETLRAAGYARFTARWYLRSAAHLGLWMQVEGARVEGLDEDAIKAFRAHLPACRCLDRNSRAYGDTVRGVRHFVDHLRARGVLPPPDSVPQAMPVVIAEFERWMARHRGVTHSTLRAYRPHLLALLKSLGHETIHYSTGGLRSFVSTRAGLHGVKWAQLVITSVRMFLRYLGSHGLCNPHLADAIPGVVAGWRLAALPMYLQPEEVERLLDSCDSSTGQGLRDRAMLLMLVRLGLRAGEVAELGIHDIDWAAATVQVSGKSRRAARLPVPQEVGDAIVAYLEDGRPALQDNHVFLRVRAPLGPITSSAVTYVVNSAMARAGVKPPRGGAHVLRHTAATTLLRQGLPLSSIGIVLRHRSIDTTAHYAKVDTAVLAEVAQPWPLELPSC